MGTHDEMVNALTSSPPRVLNLTASLTWSLEGTTSTLLFRAHPLHDTVFTYVRCIGRLFILAFMWQHTTPLCIQQHQEIIGPACQLWKQRVRAI